MENFTYIIPVVITFLYFRVVNFLPTTRSMSIKEFTCVSLAGFFFSSILGLFGAPFLACYTFGVIFCLFTCLAVLRLRAPNFNVFGSF